MRNRLIAFAAITLAVLATGVVQAETRQYCITCTEPDMSYVCQVNTSGGNINLADKGLQLYCIIRTSKDGGHKSCAVQTNAAMPCSGPVKAYNFEIPEIPPELRSAVQRYRGNQQNDSSEIPTGPTQNGGQPPTVIDLTRGAVGKSKEGLKNAGQTVGGAASKSTEKVGSAARGVGHGIAKTAGKVGSATKTAGGAVGTAAKTAWGCLTSWFKECSSSESEPAPEAEPTPLQPQVSPPQ